MFSWVTRLPLRRCIQTSARQTYQLGPSRFAKVAYGTSAATLFYVTWRLTTDSHRIALDSPHPHSTMGQSPLATQAKVTSSSHKTDSASNLSASQSTPAPAVALVTESESKPHETLDETSTDSDKPEGSDGDAQSSQGAYNPVTGEINWDCPCLGGMAHGPCGAEFREAFSCFVYSEEEPKGINCVEKFKAMQTCFREHPEIYADEIMDDDEEAESETRPAEDTVLASTSTTETPDGLDKPIASQGELASPPTSTTASS